MNNRLIHPRMLESLQRDFFPQSCALKKPSKAQNSTGQEKVTYSVRSGYEAIPCRVGESSGGERHVAEMNYAEITHTILLCGQFQDLTSDWQACIDGTDYDIMLIFPDPEGAMTKLLVRIVE